MKYHIIYKVSKIDVNYIKNNESKKRKKKREKLI